MRWSVGNGAFGVALVVCAITACSDDPAPPWAELPELPPGCSRADRFARLTEIDELERRYTALVAWERAARPLDRSFDGELPAAAVAADEMLFSLRELLARPCLAYAAALSPLPEYARWRGLTFAVEHDLFRALRELTAIHRIHGKRAIPIPPELLPEPELAERIDLRHLSCPNPGQPGATDRCRSADAALAALTADFTNEEAWILHTELGATKPTASYDGELLGEPAPRPRPLSFDAALAAPLIYCRDRWPDFWKTGDATAWASCVARRASRGMRYHLSEPIRALDRGWILLRSWQGHYRDTYEALYLDLATGTAYHGMSDSERTGGIPILRSRRLPVSDVRQLALAVMARPALVRVRSRPLYVELPPPAPVTVSAADLEHDRKEREFAEYYDELPSFEVPEYRMSGEQDFTFVVADGASLRAAGTIHGSRTGTGSYVGGQYYNMMETLAEGCVFAPFPRLLELRPLPPPPPEPNDWFCVRRPDAQDAFLRIENALAEMTAERCPASFASR